MNDEDQRAGLLESAAAVGALPPKLPVRATGAGRAPAAPGPDGAANVADDAEDAGVTLAAVALALGLADAGAD